MDYSKIKLLLTEKKISFTELASKIGMSRHGLYAAINNKTLSIVTLEKISDELGVPVTIFFDLSQLGWAPVSENEILNNEITRLQDKLKVAEEQLEDKRLILEFIKQKNLIPASVIQNKGQPDFQPARDFSDIDSLIRELENSPSNDDIEKKFELLINWFNEWRKSKKD